MPSNNPSVGIITVNYNGFDDTRAFLQSLDVVKYENYETIVVENGSTDDSASRLQDLEEDFHLIVNEENKGYPAGANSGIDFVVRSGYDYIFLLNNDTRLEAGVLTKLVKTIESDADAVAASSIVRYMEDGEIQYAGGEVNSLTGKAHYYSEVQYDQPYETELLLGACVLISTEFFYEIHGLDNYYFFGHDDIDLSCQIVKQDGKILVDPDSTIYHKGRAVAGDMSELLTYYSARNQLYFIRKNFPLYRSITAYLYFAFSRLGIFILGAEFVGSRKEYTYFTLLGIYEYIVGKPLRGPEFFPSIS